MIRRTVEPSTFALFFGNRGFFPGSLMAEARRELPELLHSWGYKTLMMDETATRFGAVETPAEGRLFAQFLEQHKGEFQGVILSLPNFGDENGAVAALKNAGVPILIQAYPDDLDKMRPELRRDAFCGKFSIMDVFWQNQIQFTALKPHTVSPRSPRFREHVDLFDRVCRVVNGMKDMVVGAVGARTTAFKTVRADEVTLQRHGVTVETFDLSSVFARMEKLSPEDAAFKEKAEALRAYVSWEGVPDQAFERLTKLGVVLDQLVEEYNLDAIALRCWVEMEELLNVAPCVIVGEMNDRGITAACEVDLGNAVAMHALRLAAGAPAACLDWNNNYGEEDDKCILFHCGPVAKSLMSGPGKITDHAILANAVGEGCAFGCHTGRIAPGPFTFGSALTDAGVLRFYLGTGRFTEDPIPDDFFGCAGVAEIPGLQDVLLHVGRNGYRHHVSVAPGHVQAAVCEALGNYLGYAVEQPQGCC